MAYLLFSPAAWQRWQPRQRSPQELAERLRVEVLLREAAADNAPERCIGIVPTERRVRWLKRQYFRWVAQAHGIASPEPALFTLAGFLWTCCARLFPPGRFLVLSDAHRLALFDEAAHQAPLRFYRRNSAELPPALLEQIAGLIDGLRRDGITAAQLRERLSEAIERNDPAVDTDRLHDIVVLAETYERLLGDDFLDEPRAWEVLTEELRQRGDTALRTLFPAAEQIVVEGFSAFRPPELAFLLTLAQQRLPVVISIDYSPDNGPLFGNFQELVERLRDGGYEPYSTDPPVLMTERTPPHERIFLPLGAYLRRWLFNTEREIRHPGFSSVVTIVECRDREQEVLAIARLVKDLLCRQGYRPHEIAVVMRKPEQYSALFREIFALYGIPANVTDRFWLVQSPVVVAVMSLLALPLNGFRRADLERLVNTPYVQLVGSGGEPIDGANLVAVAMRRRILGGHRFGGARGWIQRLQEACQFLQRHLELLTADPYSDPVEQDELQRELAACQQAERDFTALWERLRWDEKLWTPLEFLRLLTDDILVGMGVYSAIATAYERVRRQPWRSDAESLAVIEQVERDARALTRLAELAEEFVAIFRRRWGDEPRPLAEYVERFTTALRGERYQVREKPGAGVTVTSIEQTRGIPFRVLILCGAVDGEFPLPYRTEHLLGYELPDAEERHRRSERMLFYQFLTNHPDALERGEQRLVITYPLQEESEQLVRSPFVDELLKVTSLEQDGAIVSAPAVLRLLHEGWPEGEPADAAVMQQLQRAPWLLVQGTLSELMLTAWKRGQEPAELSSIAEALPEPWEPDPLRRPLELASEDRQSLWQRVGTYVSATELELYRRCPYRYFATHVLRLRPAETVPLELSPIERGILLHRIVYRFFRQLQERGVLIAEPRAAHLPPLRTAPLEGDPDELYGELLAIAREELQRVGFEHPWFTLEVEELLGTAEQPGLLWFWLQQEYRRRDERPLFMPVAVEFGFGMRPTMAEPVPLDEGVWLQGRVDRVELSVAEPRASVGIADYKSGRLLSQASEADVRRGAHLQLPLYLWAVQHVLKRDYGLEAEPAFAAFYALRPWRRTGTKEAEPSERLLLSSWGKKATPPVEQLLEQSLTYAREAVASIRLGYFPVEPFRRSTICRSCPYKALCRITQLQPSGEDEAWAELA